MLYIYYQKGILHVIVIDFLVMGNFPVMGTPLDQAAQIREVPLYVVVK